MKDEEYAAGKKRRAGSAFDLPEVEFDPALGLVMATDPGSRHCGLALAGYNEDDEWECEAIKCDPMTLLERVDRFLLDDYKVPKVLVVEEFRLYPNMLQQQGLTSIGTIEVIGAIRWRFKRGPNKGPVWLKMQGASLKIHGCKTLGGDCKLVKGKGIQHDPSVHSGPNVHARDAEAHAWWFIQQWENENAKLQRRD